MPCTTAACNTTDLHSSDVVAYLNGASQCLLDDVLKPFTVNTLLVPGGASLTTRALTMALQRGPEQPNTEVVQQVSLIIQHLVSHDHTIAAAFYTQFREREGVRLLIRTLAVEGHPEGVVESVASAAVGIIAVPGGLSDLKAAGALEVVTSLATGLPELTPTQELMNWLQPPAAAKDSGVAAGRGAHPTHTSDGAMGRREEWPALQGLKAATSAPVEAAAVTPPAAPPAPPRPRRMPCRAADSYTAQSFLPVSWTSATYDLKLQFTRLLESNGRGTNKPQ